MVTASQDGRSVVTGEVRLSYVHLNEAYTSDPEESDAKFSAVLIIPKTDKATLKALKAAGTAAAQEKLQAIFKGRMPSNVNPTLHDGDEEGDLERNPEYEGCMYMSVSSKQQPGLVDRGRSPILDPTEVYSGMYARCAIAASAYDRKGKKGITFFLNHVQKLRDGEMLGGMTRAEDAFDDVPDDDDPNDML